MPKRPPSALESERAVLGAMLRSPDAAQELSSELQPEDFYSDIHKRVFIAAKALTDEGGSPNPISVEDRTGIQKGEIEALLNAGNLTASQLKTLTAEIRRISALRTVYHACSDAGAKINKEAKLEEILEGLEKDLYRMDRAGSSEAKDGSEVMQEVVDDFLKRCKDGGGPEVSTGLKELDRAIIGLRPGKVGIIAARPSMGKTALAGTVRRAVLAQGLGVVEFNLEMGAAEIAERELAYQSQVGLRKVLAAKEVTDAELERVRAAARSINSGLWFIDDSTYNIAGIRRRARIVSGRLARKGVRVGLVILDYIQLAGENGDGREQSVAAISRGCKLMAKELGCTVLALSQLNRACEIRDDRRPIMSDLRESGSIEQDADWIGFVYREHIYNSEIPPEEAEFIIRKQRSGPTGTVRLRYNAKLVTFEDLPCRHASNSSPGPEEPKEKPNTTDSNSSSSS